MTEEHVPVRLSHLLRECSVGAVVRGPDSLMVVQDVRTWDRPGADPLEGFQYERLFDAVPERFGDRCLAGISLPTYPVARIVTGQRAWRPEQGRVVESTIWKAEDALGAGGG